MRRILSAPGRRLLKTGSVSRWVVIALLLLFANNSAADFFQDYLIDPDDGMLDASGYLSEIPYGFLPVPVIITEPATGTGLGVAGVFFNESAEEKQQRLKRSADLNQFVLPSNISVLGIGATENGSKAFGAGHLGFWYDDRLRYQGFALYPDFNLDFYNFGSTELARPIELNIVGPVLLQRLKWRLPDSNWFVGASQVYRKVEMAFAEGSPLDGISDPMVRQRLEDFFADRIDTDIATSGLGVSLQYDSRDNPMNPQQGFNYTLEYTRFDEGIGSDVDYHGYHLEGLNYFNVSATVNLGLRWQYDTADSDSEDALPPYVLPMIELRGVPAVRYQGNDVATVEMQLDYKFSPRWTFGVFTGAGRAAESSDELSDAETIDNYGVGFRYLVAKRYGFSMGIDIARGPEDTAFYIQAGSTW